MLAYLSFCRADATVLYHAHRYTHRAINNYAYRALSAFPVFRFSVISFDMFTVDLLLDLSLYKTLSSFPVVSVGTLSCFEF